MIKDNSMQGNTGIIAIMRNAQFMRVMSWLLALSFAGGSDLLPLQLGGATLYLFRLVVIMLGGIALVDALIARTISSRWFAALMAVMILWITWCFMPWFTIADHAAFQKDVFYLVIGFFTLMSVRHLVKCGAQASWLKATIAGFMVNIALGLFQALTSIQPYSAHVHALEKFSSEHFVRFAPVGMFGNPNHFAFYLMVILLVLSSFRKQLHTGLSIAFALLAGLLIFLTASKLAILSWLLLAGYVLYEERNVARKLWNEQSAVVIGACALLVVLIVSVDWRNTREIALQHERSTVASDTTHKTSYDTRGGLVTCAMIAIQETSGMGLGPGQFTAYLSRPECAEKTGGIINAHSGVLEIAAQFGVIILVLFAAVFFSLPFVVRGPALLRWCLVYLACLGLLQAANSSFLASPVAWMMLALPIIVMNSSSSTS